MEMPVFGLSVSNLPISACLPASTHSRDRDSRVDLDVPGTHCSHCSKKKKREARKENPSDESLISKLLATVLPLVEALVSFLSRPSNPPRRRQARQDSSAYIVVHGSTCVLISTDGLGPKTLSKVSTDLVDFNVDSRAETEKPSASGRSHDQEDPKIATFYFDGPASMPTSTGD